MMSNVRCQMYGVKCMVSNIENRRFEVPLMRDQMFTGSFLS